MSLRSCSYEDVSDEFPFVASQGATTQFLPARTSIDPREVSRLQTPGKATSNTLFAYLPILKPQTARSAKWKELQRAYCA